MIAMKREVAATPKGVAGFPWSECQEAVYAAKEPDGKSLYKHLSADGRDTGVKRAGHKGVERSTHYLMRKQDTHGGVYSHRLSYFKEFHSYY